MPLSERTSSVALSGLPVVEDDGLAGAVVEADGGVLLLRVAEQLHHVTDFLTRSR